MKGALWRKPKANSLRRGREFRILWVIALALLDVSLSFYPAMGDFGIEIKDQTPVSAPVSGAKVRVLGHPEMPELTTGSTGEVTWALVPAGVYDIEVTYVSAYGVTARDTARIVLSEGPADIVVQASIYEAFIKLVTPTGRPVVGAEVSVAGVQLGNTGATGEVVAPLIPAGSYDVVAKWYGQDVSPSEKLVVKGTRTYLMTADKIATLQVRVMGAQGQGLGGAHVDIKLGTTTVFSGVADSDGVVTLELPYGTYSVSATYKGVSASQDVTLSSASPPPLELKTAVFIELFGASMTFSTFILWLIMAIVVVILLIIIAQEYNIYRRKKLPQLFGPAAPKQSEMRF